MEENILNNIFSNLFSKEKQEDISSQNKILTVNKNRCPQNHVCPAIRVCPVGALKQVGFAAPQVDMDKCISCGKCVKFCPTRAIKLG